MALYSRKHNFLFFHVPRCGGASVKATLDDCHIEYEVIGEKHASAHEVLDEFIRLGRIEDFYNAAKFAFVRHPYQWIASLYEHIIADQKHPHYKEIHNFSFKDFVSWLLPNIACKREMPHGRFMLQYEFLCNGDDSLFLMNVGKTDHFARDLVTILKGFEIIPDRIQNLNTTKRTCDYMERYDESLIRKVNEFFAKDFDKLNFSKL